MENLLYESLFTCDHFYFVVDGYVMAYHAFVVDGNVLEP